MPRDGEWDRIRQPQMHRFAHVRPMAVVRCTDASDVAAAVRFMRERRVPFTVRSGGHDFAGHSTSAGVVLDVGAICQISVADGRAAVGAGARLGDVYRDLADYGRTLPGGCGPTVGIAGLTLGGGLGVLGRRHGLLCDHLRAATVVLADGSVVQCDDDRDSPLFWALRGAGHGYLGVVTEFTYDTVPVPPCVVFEAHWAGTNALEAVVAWQRWAPAAAPSLAASLLVNAPADPGKPVRVTLLGTAHDIGTGTTRTLLRAFHADVGPPPDGLRLHEASWLDAKAFLARQAPGTDDGPVYSKSEFHETPLPADAAYDVITALARDRITGEARELDFSPWAGAYNAVAADATAFPHRNARFLLKHAATLTDDGQAAPVPGPWLPKSWRITHPYGTGGVYPNFPDDELADPAAAYFGANLTRLHQVKQSYDPDAFFRPLEPTGPSIPRA